MIQRMALACGVCLVGVLASTAVGDDTRRTGELFPPSEPYDSGYLKVSDRHSIWYACCGNPQGKPVFVLHGGPGFGCYPRLTQYFNPEKFLVVLHDQRGAGRSLPAGDLRENTTQHLVADIERLRKHLEIDGKIIVFGGSWGSTLALAYAETHPERVSDMVLRGVFAATQTEIDHVFSKTGPRLFSPEAVARLEGALPRDSGEFSHAALLRVFNSDDKAMAREVAAAWCRYGVKIGRLHTPQDRVEQGFGDLDLVSLSRIDCSYMANRCFLTEGQLMRDAHRLKEIPIALINGRYDMLSPPITAYRLHRLLPKSKLTIGEEAGHSEAEPGITRALLEAVAEFE